VLIKMGNYNVIDDSVKFNEGVSVGHYNIIHPNVSLGDDTEIGNFCEIKENVTIGKNCVIQGRVRIAEGTVIGDNIVIKYGAIITRHVNVKNDVFIGPNVITLGGNHYRESVKGTIIGERCYIGGGTQIMPGISLCDDTTTGVMTFVNKDTVIPGIYIGIPAKFLRGE